MSAQLRNLIIQYAKSLPDWQKILAKRVFESIESSENDKKAIIAAVENFKFSSKLTEINSGSEIVREIDELPEAIEAPASKFKTKLLEVKDVVGVNALSEGQRITFSPKLTIIYGDNGSGKSGYSRLLNNAFYSRGDKEILPNILLAQPEQKQTEANFIFESEKQQTELSFPADKAKAEFSAFACFDKKTVDAHVGKENELFVVPREMKFFKRLADLTTAFKAEIAAELATIVETNEFAKQFVGDSDLKTKISSLRNLIDLENIKTFATLSDTFESEAGNAEREYNQLKQTDPKEQSAIIQTAKIELSAIKTYLEHARKLFDVPVVESVVKKAESLKLLEDESNKTGVDSFKNSFFQITDSTSWKLFVQSSVGFIKTEKDISTYPQKMDGCPLCLQKLSDDSIALFKRYFVFLSHESESNIRKIQKELEEYKALSTKFISKSLSDFPKITSVIDFSKDENCKTIEKYIREIKSTKDSIVVETNSSNFVKIKGTSLPEAIAILQKIEASLDEKLKSLEEEAYRKNLDSKLKTHKIYEHTRQFSSLYPAMESFFKKLIYKTKLAAEERKITTRAITDKQTSIFNEYFTKQYKTKFRIESSHLNVNFSIDVKPKGTSGSTGRKLDVLNYSPAKVLSEGEQRAIAIADFLTEAEICNISGGLIFDDPVNSLDHERKVEIAKRLVHESHNRQVIVFTHDLSFLFDLITEAEKVGLKENVDLFCHWIKKVGKDIGMIDLNHKKKMEKDYLTPTRANEYLNKAESTADLQEKEDFSRQGFDCLRQTYEAFILYKMFKETVVRFDRRIGHKSVSEVFCPPEIGKFVSQKLELCSGFVYGHLASDRYNSQSPSPDRLKREIEDFNKFEKEFKEKRHEVFGTS